MPEGFALLLVGIARTGSLIEGKSVHVRMRDGDVKTQEDFVFVVWG